MNLYTVKKAAGIIGCSTNTLYKYLNEGRLKASRGTAEQGRFRIPQSSLEEFLGTQLSTTENQPASTKAPRSLPLKFIRLLIMISLLLILFDVQLSRLIFVAIALLLAYQEGGYLRRQN
ncbi:MAG: helix-turn-helix domain-containing protein [Patescibacteria group bacterium]